MKQGIHLVGMGRIALYRDAAVLRHHLRSHILRPIVTGHIPEKRARQDDQEQERAPTATSRFLRRDIDFVFMAGSPHCSSWGR